jgi:hypothetical protein
MLFPSYTCLDSPLLDRTSPPHLFLCNPQTLFTNLISLTKVCFSNGYLCAYSFCETVTSLRMRKCLKYFYILCVHPFFSFLLPFHHSFIHIFILQIFTRCLWCANMNEGSKQARFLSSQSSLSSLYCEPQQLTRSVIQELFVDGMKWSWN